MADPLPSFDVCMHAVTMTLSAATMAKLAGDTLMRTKSKFLVQYTFFKERLAGFMAGTKAPNDLYLYQSKKFLEFSFLLYARMISVMEDRIVTFNLIPSFGPVTVYHNLLAHLNVFRQAFEGAITLNTYDLCLAQFYDGDMCLMYGPVPLHLVTLPVNLGFMTMRSMTTTARNLIVSHVIPHVAGIQTLVAGATGQAVVEGVPQAIVDYMPTLQQLTLTTAQDVRDQQINRRNRASTLLFVASYSLMWMFWGMYKLVTTIDKPSPPQFPQHNMAAEDNDFNLTHGFTLNIDYPEPREPFPPSPPPNEPEVPITSGNIPDAIDNIIHQISETKSIALVAPIVVLCALGFASNKWIRQKKIKV